MRTCIWNGCLFDRFCVLKELWQIRFWDKLKLMQCLHELSNFVNDLLWWRCLDFLKFCCCSHVKLLRLRKKRHFAANYMLADFLPSWVSFLVSSRFGWQAGWNTMLFSLAAYDLSFHTAYSRFFSRQNLGWAGQLQMECSGSTRAHHKAEFESLVSLMQGSCQKACSTINCCKH